MQTYNPLIEKGELVAVYGSLRQGLHNHPVLGQHDPEFLGTTEVQGFRMFSLGSYPYVQPVEDHSAITVEVYRVPSADAAQDLDWLEGYPSFYDRKQIDTEYGKAWIYFINEEGSDVAWVQSGDWKKFYEGSQEAI